MFHKPVDSKNTIHQMISFIDVDQAMERFKKGDYGYAGAVTRKMNKENFENQKGIIYGEYMTPDGDLFAIIHDFAWDRTEIVVRADEDYRQKAVHSMEQIAAQQADIRYLERKVDDLQKKPSLKQSVKLWFSRNFA